MLAALCYCMKYILAEIITEPASMILLNCFYNGGLFIYGRVFHFEINIDNLRQLSLKYLRTI